MNLSQAELNDAFLKQTPVLVYLHGEQIGAGIIQKHTKKDIVINGAHYLKQNCEFRIS